MYLRSIMTCHCRIWLVGLPEDKSAAIAAMPPADGLELEFFVYDRLPETTEHRPDCVIFALASRRAEKMRDLRTYKTPVFDRDGNIIGTAGVAQDITLLNRYHKKILDMAHKDELTGLSNRRFFYEYVNEYRKNQAVCIFSIDLDHFKTINDTYGHKVGDDALKAVGEVLKLAFPTAVVCRFGGDEFLVMLLGSLSNEAAKNMAEVFLARLRKRCHAQEEFRCLSGSVGIAISRDMHYPIDDLIKESDTALYAAKNAGRDCVCAAWDLE